MAEFTAAKATVHTAIGRRHLDPRPGPAADPGPPLYVPRAHDEALRADVEQAAAGELHALIVARGTSSTGKTRSLWEAVHELCPDSMVLRPRSADAARRLPGSGLFDQPGRRVVVWLNELQGFLGPNGYGLSVHVLEELYAAAAGPVVLVGTLWPDKLHAHTDPRDDGRSDTRDLLTSDEWVRWHDVAPRLTSPGERVAARELAAGDPRLAYAIRDPDRIGFTQTLAGGHEFLEHYRTAPTMARLLLDASADVRHLGHIHALSPDLLQAAPQALWDDQHGPTLPPDDWFPAALGYATQPLRSDGVRTLIPVSNEGRVGYELADYLQQHLAGTRRLRPVPDRVWDAVRTHVSRPDDRVRLARAARDRARYRYAEGLFRAAAVGDRGARRELAEWLSTRLGPEAETEQAWRDAVEAGDPGARHELFMWRIRRDVWEVEGEGEGEQALRDAIARAEVEVEVEEAFPAEQALRDALAALGLNPRLLDWQPRRAGWVSRARRVQRWHAALRELAKWLSQQPGRQAEAEQVWRDAVAAGDGGTRYVDTLFPGLAEWLRQQEEREADAERARWEAAASGDPDALAALAWLLRKQGRQAEADQVRRFGLDAHGRTVKTGFS